MPNRAGKVVIVGAGLVGSTFAYSLMISGLASEIVLIDIDEKRAEGEVMDLNHGVSFVRPVNIRVGQYQDCAGADIIVIAAGANQRPGETRLDLVKRNTEVFQGVVTEITKVNMDAILLVVTNPVDVMSYVTYRLSGYPAHRVIGSGTVLDTSRFRYLLSNHCEVDVKNVHAYIVGEHGDTEVPLWSLANVAGMRFDRYCTTCERGCELETKEALFHKVRDAAYEIIERKGATYFAVGLALLEIVESILRNENSVLTVSSLLKGYQGISDVYLSVPTIVNRRGIHRVVPVEMSDKEVSEFKHSAKVMREIINSLPI